MNINKNKQIKWNEITLKEYVESKSNCKYVSHIKDEKNIWLTLICSCGKEFRVTKGSFDKSQKQCRECGLKIHHEKLTKWNDENLREYVEDRNDGNFTYEDYDRNGNIIKFKLVCKCGNSFTVHKSSFDRMKIIQCPDCAYRMNGEKQAVWNNENLKEHVENNSDCDYISFKRISKENGTILKLKLRCVCGNIFTSEKGEFDKWRKQCPTCAKENHRKYVTKIDDSILEKLVKEKSKCEYISYYRDETRHIILNLKCPCGRLFKTDKRNFSEGKIVCNVCNGISEDFGKISLAEKCPESLDLWDYNKNDDTPYDVSYASNQRRWFKCHNGIHDSEFKLIGGFHSGSRCNTCSMQMVESRLATTLKQVIKHEFPNTIWEYDAGFKGINGGISKYDIYIPEINLLLEIQSQYHDDEKQILLDKNKKEYAIKNGFEFLALDCRKFTPLQGVQLFFPYINRIPKYVNDLKNTLINWDIELAQKLLEEDNDLTYEEIGKIVGVKECTINSAVQEGRLNNSNHKRTNKSIRKSVVQLTLEGDYVNTFESATKAKNETGANNIIECCKGNAEYSGNCIWMYEEDYLNIINNRETITPKKSRGGRIVQLTTDNKLIEIYNMTKDAAEKLNINRCSISNCLRGKSKSAGGFNWMFLEEYNKIIPTPQRVS